ncbi:MAG: hypothetical protein U0176_02505 [Bacteroidia bacterium]
MRTAASRLLSLIEPMALEAAARDHAPAVSNVSCNGASAMAAST